MLNNQIMGAVPTPPTPSRLRLIEKNQRLAKINGWKNMSDGMEIEFVTCLTACMQWRSQNAENVMHIKGRLLEQVVILFNCVPFQNGNFS